MESVNEMAQMLRESSQLELEAAQYFELDLSQLNLGSNQSDRSAALATDQSNISTSFGISCSSRHHSQQDHQHRHHHHHRHKHRTSSTMSRNLNPSERKADSQFLSEQKRAPPTRRFEKTKELVINESAGGGKSLSVAHRGQRVQPIKRGPENSDAANSRSHNSSASEAFKPISPHTSRSTDLTAKAPTPNRRLNIAASAQNGSSTTSTNSLPSISSSPSVSPSIVCPHMSIDDLLDFSQDTRNASPHTIGLCPRCRLDPPPNVHSPLSPMFKPFAYGRRADASRIYQSTGDLSLSGIAEAHPRSLRCGSSDHQTSQYTKSRSLSNVSRGAAARRQANIRDDSLDFALEPGELRRLQMSPTVRHSVEFIRSNLIESGRVLRIYKNGEPFEKPLRVCIMRGEFANIDHLLDHINTRLLVPLGARYLFHLDSQLVYSVEELKHGSIYIVSGTRTLDHRTSKMLKEQQEKEKNQLMDRSEMNLASPIRSTVAIPKKSQQQPTTLRRLQTQRFKTADNCEPTKKIRVESRRVGNREIPKSRTLFERMEVDDGALRSSESLNRVTEPEERPARLLRAKSEMSALPQKRKKNVTFMDTGRGSSPAISDNMSGATEDKQAADINENEVESKRKFSENALELSVDRQPEQKLQTVPKSRGTLRIHHERQSHPVPISNLKKELSTSSVGIQVSDTIDGFLIDLPVALPARGDDSSLRGNKISRRPDVPGAAAVGKPSQTDPKKRRQFVTITERQLSLEEMNELKDLSQGDHHHEPTVEEVPEDASMLINQRSEADIDELEVIPDRTQTIAIGCDPHKDEGTQTTPAREEVMIQLGDTTRLVTSGDALASQQARGERQMDEHWHYPGGRAASATPTERPVSQSGPNETVRARVTTPTPSLSTTGGGGDEISLSMSYDTNSLADSQTTSSKPAVRKMPATLPVKRRVEVSGKLFAGLYPPNRNFRLQWVNGFSINDLYPENSVNEQQLLETEARNERISASVSNGAATHLTPGHSNRRVGIGQSDETTSSFKPSSRYQNWICLSRRHNELIYPAGSLIVLWCQWTNEQRFYANHSSNVSAVTLATLDLDLAASAQACELHERPQISANIHLWSISELSTLMIIEDDQLRTKMIFSLRLKNSKSSGCELNVAARDEKKLMLFTFKQHIEETSKVKGNAKSTEPSETKPKRAVSDRDQLARSFSLRADKVTQSNQIPLFVMKVPSTGLKNEANSSPKSEFEPVICFGRRCFQIWSPDVRQQKMRLMQPDARSAKFTSLITKSNCLCRLSPNELLVGDSDGNIALLATNLYTSNSLGSTPKRMPTNSTPAADARDLKYGVETIVLLGPLAATTDSHKPNPSANKSYAGVTSLARVTGSLFMSADTSCAIRFWKIEQQVNKMQSSESTSIPTIKLSSDISSKGNGQIHCEQLASIALPPDLGLVCTILLSSYNRMESLVEFYIVSTCNTILFGSVKLQQTSKEGPVARASAQQELLANSSLSVVYEGHETSASSLVADIQLLTRAQINTSAKDYFYFTCSLDCRICKWNGKQLVWKSLLPSSCVSLAVHPNGFVLAVGSVDGTVYILDKVSGLLISYFPLTPVRINCLAYSSDGSLLAAACSNGSIFILPVYERGLKYKKVSIFQSPNAVVSLQFSVDNRYMLTSVTHGSFQELILWDLPNFRYMRDNVKLVADKIRWFDSICSGSEDVRAIWENANLAATQWQDDKSNQKGSHRRPTGLISNTAGAVKRVEPARRETFVTNLSCHRLVRTAQPPGEVEPKEGNYVIASDTRGFLRLFRYPSYDIQQGFFAARISSSAVNCCRFLNAQSSDEEETDFFVSSSLDGSICLWRLE